jgi:hypothetical protein
MSLAGLTRADVAATTAAAAAAVEDKDDLEENERDDHTRLHLNRTDNVPTLFVTTCTRKLKLLLNKHQSTNGPRLETCTSQRYSIPSPRKYPLNCDSGTW